MMKCLNNFADGNATKTNPCPSRQRMVFSALYLRTSVQDDFGAYWGSIEHRQAPFLACLFRDLNYVTAFGARNLTPCPDFSETTADVQRPYKNYPLGASLGKQLTCCAR